MRNWFFFSFFLGSPEYVESLLSFLLLGRFLTSYISMFRHIKHTWYDLVKFWQCEFMLQVFFLTMRVYVTSYKSLCYKLQPTGWENSNEDRKSDTLIIIFWGIKEKEQSKSCYFLFQDQLCVHFFLSESVKNACNPF